MRFNSHYEVVGKHAFLSASKYHWTNYDVEKLETTFRRSEAARRGDALHQLAKDAITLGVKFPRNSKTINQYVNDAIGFRMKPEQVLFYSHNAFGTADTISFRNNFLRIHDLKTGESPTSMRQLVVYVALFCLEYGFRPADIQIELRIYQLDVVEIYVPELDEVAHVMSQLITFDKIIDAIRAEAA